MSERGARPRARGARRGAADPRRRAAGARLAAGPAARRRALGAARRPARRRRGRRGVGAPPARGEGRRARGGPRRAARGVQRPRPGARDPARRHRVPRPGALRRRPGRARRHHLASRRRPAADPAFDHAEIVGAARDRLRAKLSYTNLGFALAPREFTISALRELYAAALGHPVSATNLQRVLDPPRRPGADRARSPPPARPAAGPRRCSGSPSRRCGSPTRSPCSAAGRARTGGLTVSRWQTTSRCSPWAPCSCRGRRCRCTSSSRATGSSPSTS